jgi:thymidylate synthase
MAKIDKSFKDLCMTILSDGREYENKNRGVKRLQVPSHTLRHLFKDGFPALTNKKLFFDSIVRELEWFLKGQTNIKFLLDNGTNIWNDDSYNWYVKHAKANDGSESNHMYHENEDGSFRMFLKKEFLEILRNNTYEDIKKNYSHWGYTLGDVGKNYSEQWRRFNGSTDQISDLIKDMKKDIMSSRLRVSAWNPSQIFETTLPPCHSEIQVIGVPLTFEERLAIEYPEGYSEDKDGEVTGSLLTAMGTPEFGFELHWNQRSVDTFLGLPFNIASYGLLAKFLEAVTGFPALGIEGTLKCVHFYDNQYDAVKEMMLRNPDTHENCSLEVPVFDTEKFMELVKEDKLDEALENIDFGAFKLIGYTSDEAIKVDMIAPKEV